MHVGELAGWASVALGQLVSWPQVLKLRRERGDGVSLASYAVVTVSMSLFFVHAIAIGDAVSMCSVPVSMVPNVMIAVTLVRRRRVAEAIPEFAVVIAGTVTDVPALRRTDFPTGAPRGDLTSAVKPPIRSTLAFARQG